MTTLLQYEKSLVEAFYKNKRKTPAGEYHKWLVKNGETFTDIDKADSRRLAKKNHCKVKECFYNSWNINLSDHSYKYYEGLVYAHGIPISHSWLVKDGKVIDPTLAVEACGDTDRFGAEYFGIEIPRSFSKVHNGSIVESLFRYFNSTN
jgi:hypothetical protein